MRYMIVDTDNFGSDYPNESFLPIGSLRSQADAQQICNILNKEGGNHAFRYYKVVELGYTLQPGFEP